MKQFDLRRMEVAKRTTYYWQTPDEKVMDRRLGNPSFDDDDESEDSEDDEEEEYTQLLRN